MRIGVFGTGGVGGYFGARLAAAGEDVAFVARGQHLAALRSTGLRVRSPLGDAHLAAIEVTDSPADLEPVEAILVAVKTWQLDDAIDGLRAMLGADTFVVPLLNGIEAAAHLGRALGEKRVVDGTCKIISRLGEPGEIVHVGVTPFVQLGETNDRASDRTGRLLAAFQRAGVRAEIPPSIRVAIWYKLMFVASVGGVGAVTRAPIGVTRTLPETRRLLRQAMSEIHRLAAARGWALPDDAVEAGLAFIDTLPAVGTTSLQRDIDDGRRSELEAWCGVVDRLGRESGIDTPVNSMLYGALLPCELRAHAAAGL